MQSTATNFILSKNKPLLINFALDTPKYNEQLEAFQEYKIGIDAEVLLSLAS